MIELSAKSLKFLTVILFCFVAQNAIGQFANVSISGSVVDDRNDAKLPYANVLIKSTLDSQLVAGTVSGVDGLFVLDSLLPNVYLLEIKMNGYLTYRKEIFIGSLSQFLDLGVFQLSKDAIALRRVVVSSKKVDEVLELDKKVINVADNVSQSGGSVLQLLQNMPGISFLNGQLLLRGNSNVLILIDGKQSALTGFGGQSGLDNLPASSVESIEIINNPSASFDANGNAGIVNIILKKTDRKGANGKIQIGAGIGALWERRSNLPNVRPQFKQTPKVNASAAFNLRKDKLNLYFQVDNLYTRTLNKNEFVSRFYDDGTMVNQQLKRNRITNFLTTKMGVDWYLSKKKQLSFYVLQGSEKIIDRGDQIFFDTKTSEQLRLWQFLEDELKTTYMANAEYLYKFNQVGHQISVNAILTYHKEDERYDFSNYLPNSNGLDAFKLLSVEKVADIYVNYAKPLKYGRIETGVKMRIRKIATQMNFYPGLNSSLDSNAGGWANYNELIPAAFSNYLFENKKIAAEIGFRLELVNLVYDINPDHNTYKSDGYQYFRPFPNLKLTYKINPSNKLTLFANSRVDRPNEVDIRIFPKYDDAEIIKVGNPALKPQYTNSVELGYKKEFSQKAYFYSSVYFKEINGTITRIASIEPNQTLIYAVFQNAGKSSQLGLECFVYQKLNQWYSFNLNLNAYQNKINAFNGLILYPSPNGFSVESQQILSGNLKLNNNFVLSKNVMAQVALSYFAPDVMPQSEVSQRFASDIGVKIKLKKKRGELMFNVTDALNSFVVKKKIYGNGFYYTSSEYNETQVFRMVYSYKF